MSRSFELLRAPRHISAFELHSSCPFLYHTITLCGRYSPLLHRRGAAFKTPGEKSKQKEAIASHTVDRTGGARRANHGTDDFSRRTSEGRASSTLFDGLTKENTASSSPNGEQPWASDLSTLTGHERKVFQKLYQMPGVKGQQDAAPSLDDHNNRSLEIEGLEGTGDETLEDIFQQAIRGPDSKAVDKRSAAQRSEDSQARPMSRRFRKSEKFSTIKWYNFSDAGRGNKSLDMVPEQGAGLDDSTRQTVRRVSGRLESVDSDADLWRLLEVEIFDKMRAASEDPSKETKEQGLGEANATRKGKPSSPSKRNRGRPSKKIEMTSMEAQSGPDTSQQSTAKGSSSKGPASESTQAESQSHEPSRSKDSAEASTTNAPGSQPLQALIPIYGPVLLHSARLFRTLFPRSPYAMAVIPKIKELGPISYVLGASTDLYNEILYLMWVYHRDLNGCAQLMEEMVSRGLIPNRRTVAVFEDAVRIRRRERGETPRATFLPDLSERATDKSNISIREGTGAKVTVAGKSSEIELHETSPGTQLVVNKDKEPKEVVAAGAASTETGSLQSDPGARMSYHPSWRGVLVGSVAAGWWRTQGTKAGWERWKAAYRTAIQSWEEDQERRVEEEREAQAQAQAQPEIEKGTPSAGNGTGGQTVGVVDVEEDVEPEVVILGSQEEAAVEAEEEQKAAVAAAAG